MLGFSAGGESDITPYLLARYFGLKHLSTLYGLAWTAFALDTALGPVLMSQLYVRMGGYPSWGIRLVAVPAFIAALAMLLMKPYPEHSLSEGSRFGDSLSLAVPKS